jgi:hypothetical protein
MEEFDDEIRKQRAQETIKQVKLEMGLLYHELEKRAGDLKVEKTVGTKQEQDSAQPENEKPDINEESAR